MDATSGSMSLTKASYGKTAEGKAASIFTLTNANGIEAKVTNFGAILVSVKTPDKNGVFKDITHGFDTLKGWENQDSYMGATAGRYANRIVKGKFSIDGKEYTLATNNGENHLHGGKKGFEKHLWSAKPFKNSDAVGVKLTRTSPDGEEGYPGNLKATVIYTLNNDDELKVEMNAETDKATVVNLCHHSYWNLSGNPESTILNHKLQLNADRFLPVDKTLIPTGELRPVKGTPFDFTKPAKIGKRINAKNTQLKYGNGYDHCWALNGVPFELKKAATLFDPKSGRAMDVYANQPGIQFYAGNFLDGSIVGKNKTKYNFRTALCLETELFPDSPNQPKFASPVLLPSQKYNHVMIHKFYTK